MREGFKGGPLKYLIRQLCFSSRTFLPTESPTGSGYRGGGERGGGRGWRGGGWRGRGGGGRWDHQRWVRRQRGGSGRAATEDAAPEQEKLGQSDNMLLRHVHSSTDRHRRTHTYTLTHIHTSINTFSHTLSNTHSPYWNLKSHTDKKKRLYVMF